MLEYGPKLDGFLDLANFKFGTLNLLTGGIAILTGVFFALWSIISQITSGRGTPIPALATQKLLIRGPFKYSRNPMSFGTILAYFGLSIFKNSISMIFLTILFSALMILYIKLLEEKELIERFGDPYREYMDRTTFIIPSFK
jgi:protein-S-isoprenylcysteine O-methyltransferase Ste14